MGMKITKIPYSPIWQFAFRNPLDVIANELSRQAMEKVKEVSMSGVPSSELPKKFSYLLEFEDPSDHRKYNLKLQISKVDEKIKFRSNGMSVNIVGNLMGRENSYIIKGDIKIGHLFDEKCLEELHSRTKEIMRHELEHFLKQKITPDEALKRLQDGTSDMNLELNKQKGRSIAFVKRYLTSKGEVDAFLRGYMSIAKKEKTPLSQVIRRKTRSGIETSDVSEEEKEDIINQIVSIYEARAKEIWPTYR
jgi:hypothetical protein